MIEEADAEHIFGSVRSRGTCISREEREIIRSAGRLEEVSGEGSLITEKKSRRLGRIFR